MKWDTLEMKLIDFVKTNEATKPLYRKLKSRQNSRRFKISSINTIEPRKAKGRGLRINLVLPTLRATRVFAGITSALKFLNLLAGEDACRIIVISNEAFDPKTTYAVDGFVRNPGAERSLWFACDGKPLGVSKEDVFILTSWKTAVAFRSVLAWQRETYAIPDRKYVYLIQDFEPGFFAWSTEYALAESTYSAEPERILAVFNSEELRTYFERRGYVFSDMYSFRPSLHAKLKELLLAAADRKAPRRKRILIYGRPLEERNAFELIRYSLEKWSASYPDAASWEILSLGESFENIPLANNVIRSKGKVSLETYAEYMLTSYAGISLMISPHPSYPPLEMSTFGVRTITNQFENKDLSSFNENVISLRSCTPDAIVEKLTELCDAWPDGQGQPSCNPAYLEEGSLEAAVAQVREAIAEMLENE